MAAHRTAAASCWAALIVRTLASNPAALGSSELSLGDKIITGENGESRARIRVLTLLSPFTPVRVVDPAIDLYFRFDPKFAPAIAVVPWIRMK
jgi:hypothetical protein